MALTGLIIFAFISFALILQQDNDAEEYLTDDPIINKSFGKLETDLSAFENNASGQRSVFEKENPTITFGSLIFYSIISAGKVFTSFLIGIYNIIIVIPASILGVNSVVFSVLGGLTITIIILALWYLYKIGS